LADGSVCGEGPGCGDCAAVLYMPSCDSFSRSSTRAVGTMVSSLECEIEGIVLGIELVLECINDHPSLNICSTVYILCDSTAATESVTRLSPGVRPQNITNLVSLQQQLSSLSVNIKLVKILGHTGLEGNYIADKLAKAAAHQILRGEISAPNDISKPAAFEIARDIARKSRQRFWDYYYTARYTYNIIQSVQTKVLFPYDRDIGISYVRLLLHDSMLKDDSQRTGTSTSPICECGSERETAEHFLIHCTKYQHIRKNS